ncbi:MAG: trehalose-phosphatase [Candidatus Omnitrophica bacterium]|nr:trehalose-phosphatase [Candidatus Omnitrophota bacterium]MDD5653556.1 trehalose-phosphatase [Candidatus Omnitrophota bacterium]
MEYLLACPDKIKELLAAKFILFLFDYDGTLAPIAPTPQEVVLPEETKIILRKLSAMPDCKIGIVSGRSLKDLKKAIGIQGIIYAGNHGFEIEGPKLKFESQVSPQFKAGLRKIARDLSSKLKGVEGVLIEDKGVTLSIHYRLVRGKDMPLFEKIISEATAFCVKNGKIKVERGKKVYEIKPPVQWDKGKAALWLLASQKFAIGEDKVISVYIGDDKTDEDAFRALKGKGITILVGGADRPVADYYLKDAEEVAKFLHLILEAKENKLCVN